MFSKYRIITIFLLPLTLPIVLIIRLIKPFILIRFGPLVNRIGHMAANTELYLCAKDIDGKIWDIFYYENPPCNQQLVKMWSRVLTVSPFAKWLHVLNSKIPGGESHIIPLPSDRDISGYLMTMQPHLVFTDEEESKGKAIIREMGILDSDSFVCFHARTSSYLDTVTPNKDWEYHNYRDSNIDNYLLAAKSLANRGIYGLRVGAVVDTKLTIQHENIIDYAANSRTDFGDIYINAKCKFFLGDTAGIYAIATIFRRPVIMVNSIPIQISLTWNPYDLFIPKKLWLTQEKRFMTFNEMYKSGAGRFQATQQYKKLGIEPIENTSEEIRDVAIEMDERLNKTWATTEEYEDLQKCFWDNFPVDPTLHGTIRTRIGSAFLYQNQNLLS